MVYGWISWLLTTKKNISIRGKRGYSAWYYVLSDKPEDGFIFNVPMTQLHSKSTWKRILFTKFRVLLRYTEVQNILRGENGTNRLKLFRDDIRNRMKIIIKIQTHILILRIPIIVYNNTILSRWIWCLGTPMFLSCKNTKQPRCRVSRYGVINIFLSHIVVFIIITVFLMQILTNTLITVLDGPSEASSLDSTMLYKVEMPFYAEIFSSTKKFHSNWNTFVVYLNIGKTFIPIIKKIKLPEFFPNHFSHKIG